MLASVGGTSCWPENLQRIADAAVADARVDDRKPGAGNCSETRLFQKQHRKDGKRRGGEKLDAGEPHTVQVMAGSVNKENVAGEENCAQKRQPVAGVHRGQPLAAGAQKIKTPKRQNRADPVHELDTQLHEKPQKRNEDDVHCRD